jgi:CheY-like chemotaxis protein
VLSDDHLSLDGIRVLVVDSDADQRELYTLVFVHQGAQVVAVASADNALAEIVRAKPDVVVSDISLPDKDGYELLQAVRALTPERGGRIPAVAVTGWARAQDRTRALAAGFQAHLAKPVVLDTLVAVVAALVGSA